jgi:hypothetical protein
VTFAPFFAPPLATGVFYIDALSLLFCAGLAQGETGGQQSGGHTGDILRVCGGSQRSGYPAIERCGLRCGSFRDAGGMAAVDF